MQMPRFSTSAEAIALEAGITASQVRIAATAVLRALHRFAVVEPAGVTAALMEAHFPFGQEACYHFSGILEAQRLGCDPELPWSETTRRFAPNLRAYHSVIEQWLAAEARTPAPSTPTPPTM